MSEKSTFHETKEVVSRLREPIKVKFVPYATTKLRGHQLAIEMNMSEDDIDRMKLIIGQIVENGIDIIENDMKSKYLGLIEVEKEI
tara:strand:- start:438 stop:695 length:258 start_codon:yes stop_codon:yes gene_type:complete